jgi:AbrB family looped-hinge helix DNA binding protein
MEVAITKMSSRGQVVIPLEMRKNIHEGEKLIIIKNDDQFIMKKADKLDKNFEEDLEFAKRTEEAWKRYERGDFISQPMDEFLKELEKC